ncbi:glycoside hydrolase family 76 protein [Hymenobacter crusticola]|uniref:glycoside hydrolase family 76 protein n=1 Tax=Hymenobacter crusticola TaxID=1770526 RepID=UPI000A379124|nr:glycoside hydrolase family 76 protein [Hymenobacter crusticola]
MCTNDFTCHPENLATVPARRKLKTGRVILPALLLSLLAGCQKEDFHDTLGTGLSSTPASSSAVVAKSEALLALSSYDNKYYNQYGTYGPSFKANYWFDIAKTKRMDFWTQAEAIETVIDAYNVNPTTEYKNKIQYLYNGMRDAHGLLWSSNEFNDDVIWGSLMCIRAYEIWNDGGMLDMARQNFDLVWARGWDTTLGGGLWWKTDKLSKNTCVNAPAAICAMRLYKATGNTAYRDKAKLIMDWLVSRMYVASTGEVKGAMNQAGQITEGALLYTQGTFIGAANELRPYYTSPDYRTMGLKAMDYARTSLSKSPGGILQDEDAVLDIQGGKSIFARWACIFVKETGTAATYGPWLDLNATQAWSIRNSNGIMWNLWSTRTSDTENLNSWRTNGGVSMMLNLYRFR